MMKTISFRSNIGARTAIAALLCGTMLTPPAVGQEALPTGGQVVSGSATIQTSGPSMTVNQSTDKMIANWQSFSIGAGNSVTFNQPNAQSVALNRVIGQDPSRILGSLNANGHVFLLNPNGIVIGKGGQVQTGGFVSSTLGMSNTDFLSGNYRFNGTGGSILNQGDLKGGVVALIAPRVQNEGTITGNTALAAGTDVTLDFDGDGLLAVEVSGSLLATLVENQGLIQADGGVAILTAKGANDALRGVVNNSGVIEAQSLTSRDGRILLLGDMDNGEVNAAGTLQASFVETSAAKVNILDNLQVKTGGGKWLIDPTDFIIAASGGDMTGTTLSNNLTNGNVEITTLGRGSNSDIFVNDSVTWSSHTLTLDADRNITINAPLYGSGTAGLVLEYAQRSATGDYFINAPVNLASTGNFTTWNYNLVTNYTIITSLGTESSFGDGTLQGMRGNLSGNYVLGSDIDASSTASWNGGQGFEPIGNELGIRFFDGIFDGLGHKIDGLIIDRLSSNYVGLFGQAFSANIQNIGLEGGSFKGNRYVGSIAGLHQSSSITNAWSSAEVSGTEFVGGLVGDSYQATVSKSRATGDVEGQTNVGGLIGRAFEGSINGVTDSYAAGNVSGTNYVGGLIGTNSYTEIRGVFASGDVTGDGHIGGLVGGNEASIISDAYATGSVTGISDVGGLAGGNFRGSTISNSYAAGHVVGSTNVGGLVGQANSITGPNVVERSFWDTEATGQSSACGQTSATCNATGLTTTQMKTSAPFIAAGWDFTNVWAIDPAINNGYPYLRATVATTVAPPPPPPPPPVVLAVNDFAASFSAIQAPYQQTITLSGTGFNSVTEVRFAWTDPNGQTGTITWDAGNSFGGGRFVVGSDTSATISPVLIAAGDPSGTYQWTVTFVAGTQTDSQNFAVTFSPAAIPPAPTPEPEPVPQSETPVLNVQPDNSGSSGITPDVVAGNDTSGLIDMTTMDLTPNTLVTSMNFDFILIQILKNASPELASYLGDKIGGQAFDEMFGFIVRNGNLTMSDLSDFATGYVQSSGYRDGINKLLINEGRVATESIMLDILLDLSGNLSYYIAKRNGASDWSADFSKYLTESVATGLILGPQAQAKKAIVDIVESGAYLTIETVSSFNQHMNEFSQIAASADGIARQALASGDKITYARMLTISSGARQAIVDMYANHPIIATMAQIPNTIKSLLPH